MLEIDLSPGTRTRPFSGPLRRAVSGAGSVLMMKRFGRSLTRPRAASCRQLHPKLVQTAVTPGWLCNASRAVRLPRRAEPAGGAMAFQRRLVHGARSDGAADGFDTAAAFAQQMVIAFSELRAVAITIGRLNPARSGGRVNIDDLDLGAADLFAA